MKSRQINFYLLPSEQAWFESALRKCGDFVVVVAMKSATETEIVADTVGQEPAVVYLARPGDQRFIFGQPVPKRESWYLDDLRSQAVEFTRCYLDGRVLRRGRLYVVTSYYDEQRQLVSKDKDFLSWTDCLLRRARQVLARRDDGDYIGPQAQAALRDGTITTSL